MAEADTIDTVEAIRRLTADISDQEVESGSDDQHDFVILARTVYRRRELAVSLFYTALCDGALVAAIRLATGMLPIANMEWRTTALWREIIMSGEIHASAGERFERYNGAPVLLSAAAFETWLQQRRPRPESPVPPSTAVEDKKIRRRGGGRKEEYDWGVIRTEFLMDVYENGVPENLSEARRKLLDWCVKQFGEDGTPSDDRLKVQMDKWIADYERTVQS